MPEYNAAIALGVVELTSRIDLRGYQRDKSRVIADVNRFSADLGAQMNAGIGSSLRGLNLSIERELVAGYANAMRQIERMMSQSAAFNPAIAQRMQIGTGRRSPDIAAASFGAPQSLAGESRLQGKKAGEAMGQGVAEGFRSSEPYIQASFNKSISGAILATDALKFGLKKMVSAAMGSLPGQISQVVASTMRGGGLSEQINIELETNTAVSTLSALTTLDISGATRQVQELNERLAESAAALPGNTQDYKRLATVLSDNVAGAFKDVNKNLDTKAYTDSLASISESFGAITASSTRDIGNTSLALSRALSGASGSELRMFALFEQNATALNAINQKLAETGVTSLRDLTLEGRVKLLEAVGKSLITDDYKKLAENSVDGLLQSFRSKLFDPSTGIFGINRDLDEGLEGTQSVFTSFASVLKGLISENSEDMGLIFRIAESAKAAGANIGDPLMNQKRILDAIASAIEVAKTKTDEFFQSAGGQALIATYNALSGALNSIFTGTADLQVAFIGLATVAGGPLGAAIAFVLTNLERVLPVIQSVAGMAYEGFQAALPILQQFGDIVLSLAESAVPVLQSGLQSVLSIFEKMAPMAQQVGAGISGLFSGGGAASSSSLAIGGTSPDAEGSVSSLGAVSEGMAPILENLKLIAVSIGETVGHVISLIQGILPSLQPILDAFTDLAGGAIAGIANGLGILFNGIKDNAAGIKEGFSGIAAITEALKPGLISLGELLGTAVLQAINLAAGLLSNEDVLNSLVDSATILSDIITAISEFVAENKWVVKVIAIAAAITGIVIVVTKVMAVVGMVTAAWGALTAAVAGVAGFIAAIGGAIAGAFALLNPVTLTVLAIAAAAVGIGVAIRALWPDIKKTWESFKKSAGEAMESAKKGIGDMWAKTEGLRDRFGEVSAKIGEGVTKFDEMFKISKSMEGPMSKLKELAGGLADNFKKTFEWLMKSDGPLKRFADFLKMGGGGGGGGGGAFKSGLFTGPAANIGGSSAYHIDTKLSKDLSRQQKVELFDKLAAGYAEMGKEIEFSNSAVSGEIYNLNASFEEKAKLLDRAAAAHSHNLHAAYDSFDYYIPDIGKGRRDRSTEGAEMLLPNVSGGRVEYASGGGYGNFATIYDENGKVILKQGHGDNRRAIPTGRALSDAASAPSGAPGGGVMGAGGVPQLGSGYGSLNALAPQLAQSSRFDTGTAEGRAALAIALGIGGSESLGKGINRTDFFTLMGGTGDNMKGFAQFNQEYHAGNTATPGRYSDFLGSILHGNAATPNGRTTKDFAGELAQAIQSGSVTTGQQLISWMQRSGLGGSNWQGVDDGWGRAPELADQLVGYLRSGGGGGSATDTKYGYRRQEVAQYTRAIENGQKLAEDAADAYKAMDAAANAAGLDLRAISGFRDLKTQEYLWNRQIQRRGSPEAAAEFSAPPGYSNHHTGNAVDIGSASNPGTDLERSFENTPEFKWLQENAKRFGFEMPYYKGNNNGAGYEPWEWKFTGGSQSGGSSPSSAIAGSGIPAVDSEPSAPVTSEADFKKYIEPSMQAQRDLEEVRNTLKRKGQLNQQARLEEDRQLQEQRRQRKAEIARELSELDPTDTVGKLLLEYQQNKLAIEEASGDRVRAAERAIADLEDQKAEKVAALNAVKLKRANFEFEMARQGDTAGVTEESLRKEEAAISAIDFTAAIAEYQRYKDELTSTDEVEIETLRNRLMQQLDEEVKNTEKLVRETTALNNQYGDTGPLAKYLAQVEAVNLAYEETIKKVTRQVEALDKLIAVENLSEERMIALTTQRVAAQRSLDGLTAAQERANEVMERNYKLSQRAEQEKIVDDLLQNRLRLIEAEAKSIERFDSEGAATMRRRAAEMNLLITAEREYTKLREQEAEAVRRLDDAIAQGDTDFVERQAALGRGTVEDLRTWFAEVREGSADFYKFELEQIANQFPTIAEKFSLTMQESFSAGLESGILKFTQDGSVFGLIGSVFKNLFDSVIKEGASKATEFLTGKVFGNGDKPGWLDGILGSNESTIPGQSKEAAELLEEGGLNAGQQLVTGAEQAKAILESSTPAQAIAEGKIGTGALGLDWQGIEKEPAKASVFENAGITLGKTFIKQMPDAGKHFSAPFVQTLAGAVNSIFSGGKVSGGGILNLLGSFIGMFAEGGSVGNFAGGGMVSAIARERAQGSGQPRVIVANTDEFIIRGPATRELTKKYGSGFLEGLNQGKVFNYAAGGFADSIQAPAIATAYQPAPSGRDRATTIRADFRTVSIGGMDFVSKDQFDRLQDQINQKASAGEAAETVFGMMRDYPEVRGQIGI